jgi:hypothetical protein
MLAQIGPKVQHDRLSCLQQQTGEVAVFEGRHLLNMLNKTAAHVKVCTVVQRW